MEKHEGEHRPGRGVFITFEGIEGSGKTTQMSRVENAVVKIGRPVFRTREPGGTRIGERIREVLLAPEHGSMAPMTELLLYEACRAQLVTEAVRAELQRGSVILCDRFSDATVAYQGHGRGLDLDLIETLNRMAMGGTEPDLTLLLDCPVEQGLERVRGRLGGGEGNGPAALDRLESEDILFHERVRKGYLAIAAGSPDRVRVVDSLQDEDYVYEEIMRHVSRLLRERGA